MTDQLAELDPVARIDALITADPEGDAFSDVLDAVIYRGDPPSWPEAAEGHSDHTTEIRELVAGLTPAQLADVAGMVELCPVHLCDAQICADDEVTECGQARA